MAVSSILARLESPRALSGRLGLADGGQLRWSEGGVWLDERALEPREVVVQLSRSEQPRRGLLALLRGPRRCVHAVLRVPGREALRLRADVSDAGSLEGLAHLEVAGQTVPAAELVSLLETLLALGAELARHTVGVADALRDTIAAGEAAPQGEPAPVAEVPQMDWPGHAWTANRIVATVLSALVLGGAVVLLPRGPLALSMSAALLFLGMRGLRYALGTRDAIPHPVASRWLPVYHGPRTRRAADSEVTVGHGAAWAIGFALLFQASLAFWFLARLDAEHPILDDFISTAPLCLCALLLGLHDLLDERRGFVPTLELFVTGQRAHLYEAIELDIAVAERSSTHTYTAVEDGESVTRSTTQRFQRLSLMAFPPTTLALVRNGRVERLPAGDDVCVGTTMTTLTRSRQLRHRLPAGAWVLYLTKGGSTWLVATATRWRRDALGLRLFGLFLHTVVPILTILGVVIRVALR